MMGIISVPIICFAVRVCNGLHGVEKAVCEKMSVLWTLMKKYVKIKAV